MCQSEYAAGGKEKEVEAELEAAIHKGRSCGLTDHDLTELFEIVLEG